MKNQRERLFLTNGRDSRFTLVELMVGMAMLSIIMLMMFQFLIAAQRTLEISDSVWKIYESSRMVFDLIERDLQAASTSSVPGQEIGFYIGDPEPTDESRDLHICLVASTEPPETASLKPKSRLCEISYKHHTDSTAMIADLEAYTLTRQIVSDVDKTNWNFRGATTNWHLNGTEDTTDADGDGEFNFEKVVGGVSTFTIDCYEWAVDDTPITGGAELFKVPEKIVVTLELFDEDLIDAPEAVRIRTLRSFTRVFFPTFDM